MMEEEEINKVTVMPSKKQGPIVRLSWMCYQIAKGAQPLIIVGIGIVGLSSAGVNVGHWTFWLVWVFFAMASLGYYLRINEKLEG